MTITIKDHPILSNEWDEELNKKNGLSESITIGSGKHAFWICPKGHRYEASICNRSKGCGCPYCAGKKVLPGFNDLSTLRPDLAQEWDYSENTILPNEVTLHSDLKVAWICLKGHKWISNINNRSNGNGCPVCNGKTILVGFNDLATTHPHLVKEWDHVSNGDITKYTHGSTKKVRWICKKGHNYTQTIYAKTSGAGCPICCNQKLQTGFNDLQTVRPRLVKEWDYSKNSIKPEEIISMSTKDVWWICPSGHSYLMSPYKRKYNGCPYCSKRYLLKGFNDLQTCYPKIAQEWDYQKNAGTPSDYMAHSSHHAWWICQKGHSWQTSIHNRTAGNNCPYCAPISYGIEKCNDYLRKNNIEYVTEIRISKLEKNSDPAIRNLRFDYGIIQNNKIIGCIEFDGIQHFRSKNKWKSTDQTKENDIKKNQFMIDHNIPLLRIRYDQVEQIDNMIEDFIKHPEGYSTQHNTFLSNNDYYSILEESESKRTRSRDHLGRRVHKPVR